MAAIDAKPDYKRLYREVKRRFDATSHFKHGPFDETFYTLRVYETCKQLIRLVNKNVQVQPLLVASILHDIGKIRMEPSRIFGKTDILKTAHEEWHRHPKLGVPIARQILKKQGYSEPFINEVCYLIENHDKRGSLMKNRSLELKILQDADLLSDEGIAGFIRPFLYCGKFNSQSIIGSIRFIQQAKSRLNKRGMLNLEVSKKLAKEKLCVQDRLIAEISKEINSDLL